MIKHFVFRSSSSSYRYLAYSFITIFIITIITPHNNKFGKLADIGPTHFILLNKMFFDELKTCSLMGF